MRHRGFLVGGVLCSLALGCCEAPGNDEGPADLRALLAASETATGDDLERRLQVRRNVTGRLKSVFGPALSIPLGRLGCDVSAPDRGSLCFMRKHGRAFGVASPSRQVFLQRAFEIPKVGGYVVHLGQMIEHYPVFAAAVVLLIDASGSVIHVFSGIQDVARLPDGMLSEGEAKQLFAALVKRPPAVLEERFGHDVSFEPVTAGVYVDSRQPGMPAIPAIWGYAAFQEYRRKLVVLDARDLSLLHFRDATNAASSRHLLYTTALRPELGGDCGPFQNCEGNLVCAEDDFKPPGRCVRECTSDADCSAWDYRCFTPASGELRGFCYKHPHDGSSDFEKVWDSDHGHWVNNKHSTFWPYWNLVFAQGELEELHRSDLGIAGWNDADGVYRTKLYSACHCQEDPNTAGPDCSCHYGEDCNVYADCGPAHANSAAQTVWLPGWFGEWSSEDTARRWNRLNTLSHEYTHLMVGATGITEPPEEACLGEGLPQIFGALFARRQEGATKHDECGFESDGWGDRRSGLAPSCANTVWRYRVPYAIRSRFDMLPCNQNTAAPSVGSCTNPGDCPEYMQCWNRDDSSPGDECSWGESEYNFDDIWRRLNRLLAMGSADFIGDTPNGEYIDIPDDPIGFADTASIYYTAMLMVNGSTSLHDFGDSMMSAGALFGHWHAVTRALGAAGFWPTSGILEPVRTNIGAVSVWFRGWELSVQKSFTFWVDESGSITYSYYDGPMKRYGYIRVNTDSRPMPVEYRDWLHVFFRDKDTRRIGVYVMRKDKGVSALTPDVGFGQLAANGAVAATVFMDQLYLVFGDAGSGQLMLAKCNHPTVCTAPAWWDFGGGQFEKLLHGQPISPGPAAVGASQLNGLPWDQSRLMVAVATDRGGHIRVLTVDQTDEVESIATVPDHYPSHRTRSPLTVLERDSAWTQWCGGAAGACRRRYLYLGWQDLSSPRVYTSVLQNLDPAEIWFTKSLDSGYAAAAGTGASYMLGGPPHNNVGMTYVDEATHQIRHFGSSGHY